MNSTGSGYDCVLLKTISYFMSKDLKLLKKHKVVKVTGSKGRPSKKGQGVTQVDCVWRNSHCQGTQPRLKQLLSLPNSRDVKLLTPQPATNSKHRKSGSVKSNSGSKSLKWSCTDLEDTCQI
jgi:hypothetical protein